MELAKISEFDDVEEDINSHIRRFYIDGDNLTVQLKAPRDGRRKEENRMYTNVDFSFITHNSIDAVHCAFNAKVWLIVPRYKTNEF